MRRLLSLLQREWRDARVVTIAAAIVAVLALVAVNVFFVRFEDCAVMAVGIVPTLLGIYLAVIASDLVAAEVATGRIDSLALLPSGMLRVWTAKVAFTLVAGTVFFAWLVVTELALLAIGGVPNQVGAFLLALPEALPNLGFVFVVYAGTLFFSTLLHRGFAAVVAGLLVLAGVLCLWIACDWAGWSIDATHQRAGEAATAIALVFLAGSAAAFVRGPAHGPALRRALVGIAVPLGVFIPVGIGSAVALDRMLTLEAGSPDARIVAIFPSPDAKYVALRVEKDGCPSSTYLWIVRTADGSLVAWRDPHLYVQGWSDDGHVTAWNYTGGNPWHNSNFGGPTKHRWFDPTRDAFGLTLTDDPIDINGRAEPAAGPARSLLHKENGRWVVRDAALSTETTFDDMPKTNVNLYPWAGHSAHARYAIVGAKSGTWILDLVERRIVYSADEWIGVDWVRGYDDDRYALVGSGSKPTRLIDLSKTPHTEVVPTPGQFWCHGESIVAAPGGGFFLTRNAKQLDLVDEQCRTIRHVYPPDR